MRKYISPLVELGLTELEAKVYVTLLKKKTFTASELSSASQTNRTQTYDVLSKLSTRGMVLESRGKVKKYSAVNPDEVLASLKTQLEKKNQLIVDLAKPLSNIYHKNEDNSSLDFIQVLGSRINIINKIEKLEFAADKEILSFCKPPYMMNISFSYSQERADIFNSKSKLKQKSIYQAEMDNIDKFVEWVEIFSDAGEQVRISLDLPIKFVIFDNEKVVCTIKNPAHEEDQFTAMFVDNKDLSNALTVTFDTYWKNSMTIDQFKKTYKTK